MALEGVRARVRQRRDAYPQCRGSESADARQSDGRRAARHPAHHLPDSGFDDCRLREYRRASESCVDPRRPDHCAHARGPRSGHDATAGHVPRCARSGQSTDCR